MMIRPLIIGHRGSPIYARENTLASFEMAIALQADMVEFDVRRTRDRVLIIYHDIEIEGKPVRHLNYRDIQAWDPTIPTLDEAIALCRGKIKLDVELKEAGYERRVVERLLAAFSRDEFVITSFHPFAVKNVKRRYPAIRAGFLFGDGSVDFCHRFRLDKKAVRHWLHQMQADFIAPNWELLDTDLLSQVVTGHLPIWVWTVNEASVIQQLLGDRRIEGIITDRPDLGRLLREEWRASMQVLA